MPKRRSIKTSSPSDFEPKRKNPIQLGSDSYLDNDFKPLRVSNDNTGIELSKTQIKASKKLIAETLESTEIITSVLRGQDNAAIYGQQFTLAASDSDTGWNINITDFLGVHTSGIKYHIDEAPWGHYMLSNDDSGYMGMFWQRMSGGTLFGGGTATTYAQLRTTGSFFLLEQASSYADIATFGQIWIKDETPNELWFTTDAGNDIQLTSGTTAAFVGDITSVVAGTNCSGGGTTGDVTINVDDAFLVNDADDTTTGTITAAGFTTTGTWTFDDATSGTVGITTVHTGSSFADNDTSLMTAGAIKEKIEAYGYSTASGDITGVTITTDSGGGSAASDTGGSADFSILGSNGVGVTNSGTTITAVAVPSEIDHDSLNNFVANEHIDWTASSAGTIHSSNYTNTTYSAGSLLDLSTTTFNVDLTELTDGTADVVGADDELVYLDDGSQKRKQIDEIKLGQFNNDQSWTSNAGTVTSVGTTGTVNGLTLTGTVTSSGNLTLGGTLAINNGDWSGTDLSVANGGTGASSLTDNSVLTGTGTSAITAESNLTFDGTDLSIAATGKIYLDGGTHSYIVEGSGDSVSLYAGGDEIINFQESGDDGNSVYFRTSCAGFNRQAATFSTSGVIGDGNDSTDVDFRHSNKYHLELTNNISGSSEYINMIFPSISGNFILAVIQDGTGSRTVASAGWRAYANDETLCDNIVGANGTDGEVRWAGGSAPTLTTTANKTDIISIYWDADDQTAFCVATLNF